MSGNRWTRTVVGTMLAGGMAIAVGVGGVASAQDADTLRLPASVPGPQRLITTGDLARIRDIDTLSVSPDGKRYAILVRQAVPEENRYRTAWFTGSTAGGPLNFVADGGEARKLTQPDGQVVGDIVGGVARWSPDGQWIAFARQANGEVQLWRARIDGSASSQVSHNPGDVRDFVWSPDGSKLIFIANTPRAERAALLDRRAREGNRLQDFGQMADAVHSGVLPVPLATNPPIFAVNADGSAEHAASEAEAKLYRDSQAAHQSNLVGGTEIDTAKISAAFRPSIVNARGAAGWMAKVDPSQEGQLPIVQIFASPSGKESEAVRCTHAQCTGQMFGDFQWSPDGKELLFSHMGPRGLEYALYAWNPTNGRLRTIANLPDSVLRSCTVPARDIICLREERLRPAHVVAIDLLNARTRVLADVNPEFQRFRFGRIERLTWDTPRFPNGATQQTRGYLIYPPDYDPKKSYPLFVAPYSAYGFARGDGGDEHPLLVYAANGMIVLNSEFPIEWNLLTNCATFSCTFQLGYDPKLGYPHLASYAATTFAGIDEAMKHANIDAKRIGIGGVSHGAFVPLYMLQQADRLAALSIAQGSWHRDEYATTKLQEAGDSPREDSSYLRRDDAFWRAIDISAHPDKVEAPILFHFADFELQRYARQVRDIADAGLPFEAYSFPGEYHFKVQPAHRMAIYNRNLDWFRFWLEDREDSDPAKAEQYARWRKLRELQCRNPRGPRGNYCASLNP